MKRIKALAVDLEKCIGCFACEVACKQEHHVTEGAAGISVLTLGPFRLNNELAMDFVPVSTKKCDLCAQREKQGKTAFCAEICPTQALAVYEAESLLALLRSNLRVHLCKTTVREDPDSMPESDEAD